MRNKIELTHEFVEYIPNYIKEGVIYISIAFATVVHKCCCGCGEEVVTPLSPTDWKLIFDGQTISLDPSIGNWNFDCQSHYWIKDNIVTWAPKWSQEKINDGRRYDALIKTRFFSNANGSAVNDKELIIRKTRVKKNRESFWQKLKKLLFK
jgi:hypothetical protein